MFAGMRNKFIVFIVLFGTLNIIMPILTNTTYDPNNIVLSIFSIVSLCYFLWARKKHDISILIVFGIIIISFIFLLFEGGVSFSYYTKWVIFSYSLLMYYMMLKSSTTIAEGNYKLLYYTTLLQIVLFVIQAFSSTSYITMESGTYLILCFDNKNATAMHLLTLCCILILYAKRVKQKSGAKKTIVPLLAFLVCLYLLYLTGSRSSLVGALFIIPFYFFPKARKLLSKPVILILILMPFIFGAIYVLLYKAGYQDIQLLGRRIFNGRQDLWIPVFDGNLKSWLFGMHADFARPDGIPFQLHNGIIDLIASYGIIVTTAFIALIYKWLVSLLDADNERNYMIVVCVCALILQSIGEAALFNGTRAVYICMIMMFSERNIENVDTQGIQAITKNRIKHST